MKKVDPYSSIADEQLLGIDAACEVFERALQAGRPIPIEDSLAAVGVELRGSLFCELLAIELECRARDELPDLKNAYRSRFAELTDEIERVFDELTAAEAADGQLNGPSGAAPVSVSVPGYEIEGVLGRGGLGVVYKARHLSLKRTVALKMVLAGGHAGPHELARFRLEAEAVARLQHPNIVQIHEVGETDGHPYCALEFVDGGDLAAKLNGKPMPANEAATLVETLARAMQLAHSRNVIHRDLKPANILLAADGTPKITDFGLARQLDSDSDETKAGAVIGTPSYMAPEQASGHAHEAGPAADVYSLGAILFDCLTGRPPFKGGSVVETLEQVRSHEPNAPSQLQPDVPLDLDTICLKCLRKEPEKRYASAAELADELVRYQRGEPILARPTSRGERAVKWVKRNPAVAAAMVAVALALTVGTTVSTLKYLDAEAQRGIAVEKGQAADKSRNEAEREQKAERWGRYRANIAAASAALQVQNNSAARGALDDAPEQHRGWEWHYLYSQLDSANLVLQLPTKPLSFLVVSPDGRQFAAHGGQSNEIYLYDVATGKLDTVLRGHLSPPACAVYHPDGKQIATADDDATICIWDARTGRELKSFRAASDPANQKLPSRIVYNADGSRIASFTFSNAIVTSRLWDPTAGKQIAVLSPWKNDAGFGAFSPDGKRVAVGSGKNVNLFDAVTGQRLAVLGPHPAGVRLVTFSPNGKRLAAESYGAISLWDGASGKAVAQLRVDGNPLTVLCFSPDGSRLLAGSDFPASNAHLWDAATGRSLAVFAGHKNNISAVAFSPDGKRVATASMDQTARLWDPIGGTSPGGLAVLRGHTGIVNHVVFSPNSKRLVTAADDSTLRLWDAQTGELLGVLRGHSSPHLRGFGPVFTADGSRMISAAHDGTVRIWEVNQVERNVLRGHTGFVYDVAFSPNGAQVASAAWDGTARLWDATTGRQTGVLKHESPVITSVSYSRDGLRLATRERYRGVALWDVASQKTIRNYPLPAEGGHEPRASLNPDGTLLASGNSGGPVLLWDAASGREVAQLAGHRHYSTDVAFHPDGGLLASTGTIGYDTTLRLWDVATRRQVAVLNGHAGSIWRVAFSADGKLLASASGDKTIRIWDPQTHEQLAVIPMGSIIYGVAFSPDGTRLAAGCADNSIRLFDVASRAQVAELRGHTDYVHAVAWSPDGTRLVSGSGDGTARVWDSLSPSARTAK